MDFLGIGSLIGGLGQGVMNYFTSKYNTDKTNEANKELANFQYSKDLEMWNKQNAYNSPQAQMDRFAKAGLNPNLIYGQGTAGNATTIPHYQAPRQDYHYEAPQIMPMIGAYLDTKIKSAQYDSIKEDIKSKEIQNALAAATLVAKSSIPSAQLEGIQRSNWYKNLTNQFYENTMPDRESMVTSQSDIADSNAKMARQKLSYNDRFLLQTLTNLKQVGANLSQDYALKSRTLEKYSAEITNTSLRNDYQRMFNKYYGSTGFTGTKDIIPLLRALFGK